MVSEVGQWGTMQVRAADGGAEGGWARDKVGWGRALRLVGNADRARGGFAVGMRGGAGVGDMVGLRTFIAPSAPCT